MNFGSIRNTYDTEARQHKTVTGVAGWTLTFVILTFTFAYCWRLFVGPYTDFYNERTLAATKAKLYLETDVCRDYHVRARLEGFNECEQMERILKLYPSANAFYDLMNWLSICQDGVCTVGGINVTDSLWTGTRIILALAGCLYIASIFGMITSNHGRNMAYYQLPQAMPMMYDTNMMQYMHGQKQQFAMNGGAGPMKMQVDSDKSL